MTLSSRALEAIRFWDAVCSPQTSVFNKADIQSCRKPSDTINNSV